VHDISVFGNGLTLENYAHIFDDPMFAHIMLRSVLISSVVTVATIVLSFPVAHYIAFTSVEKRNRLMMQITLPFLLYTPTAMVIALAHAYAVFAVLPMYVSLSAINRIFIEAAADLGASKRQTFVPLVLPMAMPGVLAAAAIVFIPTRGDFVTPLLVGGPDSLMIGNLISPQFGNASNWQLGAALVVTMMVILVMKGRFLSYPPSMEEAAYDLGASEWPTLVRVSLPIVLPGIVASFLLSFTLSFDEFIVSFFLVRTEPTLPILTTP